MIMVSNGKALVGNQILDFFPNSSQNQFGVESVINSKSPEQLI